MYIFNFLDIFVQCARYSDFYLELDSSFFSNNLSRIILTVVPEEGPNFSFQFCLIFRNVICGSLSLSLSCLYLPF